MKLTVYNFLLEQVEQDAKKSRFEMLKAKFVDELKKLTVQQLIEIGKTDPTSQNIDQGESMKMGSYSQWILKQYLKILPEKWDITNKKQKPDAKVNLFWEDLYKLDEWLKKYHRFKQRIEDATKRDINKVDSIRELQVLVRDFSLDKVSKTEKIEMKKAAMVKDIDYLYNDGTWEVISPKSWIAAKLVSLNPGVSDWCTSASGTDSNFRHYTSKGPLYIIRKPNEIMTKGPCAGQPQPYYQFCFGSDDFMDIEDQSINLAGFLHENRGLAEFFKPIIEEQLKKSAATGRNSEDILRNRIFRTYTALWGMDEQTERMVVDMLKAKVAAVDENLEISTSSYSAFIEMLHLEKFVSLVFEFASPRIKRFELILDGQNTSIPIPDNVSRFTEIELLSFEYAFNSVPESIIHLTKMQLFNVSNNVALNSLPQLPTDDLTVINISNTGIQQVDQYLQDKVESDGMYIIQ